MATCTAPGKIYLFGEHAVVYGKRAIASAINLRTTVTVAESDQTTIASSLGTTGIDYIVHPYISRCIESLSVPAVSIKIDSEIPVGSGLGSSAAAVIATLGALNHEFELGMDKTALARAGHAIEREVQGAASPTDTFVSTMGGTVVITPGASQPVSAKLRLIECGIVIGDTQEFSSTKELVGNVRILHERYPAVMNPIFDTIDSLAEIGVPSIRAAGCNRCWERKALATGVRCKRRRGVWCEDHRRWRRWVHRCACRWGGGCGCCVGD